MGLREFTDQGGRRWRVWDIRPEQMHAATRAEDHLQSVINGWLAFEPAGGGEKRRLAPIPPRWDSATEAELESMLEQAEPARGEVDTAPKREGATSGERTGGSPTGARAPTVRTFRYPTGQYWIVNELATASTSSEQHRPLLRFTSGNRSLDTADWPADWARMSELDLADLLYRSFPRDGSPNPTELRRRRGDVA